jgi:hypothetical protein
MCVFVPVILLGETLDFVRGRKKREIVSNGVSFEILAADIVQI